LKNTIDLGANAGNVLAAGITLEQEGNSHVALLGSPNYAGAPYNFTAVQTYVAANNTVTNGNGAPKTFAFADSSTPAGGGYFGTCT
jgi:hypothetical protein